MSSTFFNNHTYKKEIFFFFFLYFTLIISFFLGENSTGGAVIDYSANKITIKAFASEFLKTFYGYESVFTRHSPVLYIFLSLFERINLPDFLIRLIHLHLCLLLPFLFYKCLTIKFNEIDKKILLFLSCLIFLSPTFRTLAIWPDSRLLGLTLFTLSVYYFLKFEVNKDFKFAIYNVISLALSAYISPNFSVFSIFFFTKFVLHYSIFSKKILSIIIINLFLALPAFYYIFILDINFFLRPVASGIEENERIFFGNVFNDILITFSIIFFYLIPFLFFKIIKINNVLNIRNILISISIFSICVFNFDYNILYSGGGIFFKISNYLFDNNYLFYLISLFSIPIILSLILKNYLNILLFVIIILNNPQYTIYHKYFDPFLLITYLTIFYFSFDLKKIFHAKNHFFIFAYFLAFLIISNIKLIYV
tara:strand:- start:82 stop:1347 length:1266 start_codon:yes stop_codon:yes gene_type:complete